MCVPNARKIIIFPTYQKQILGHCPWLNPFTFIVILYTSIFAPTLSTLRNTFFVNIGLIGSEKWIPNSFLRCRYPLSPPEYFLLNFLIRRAKVLCSRNSMLCTSPSTNTYLYNARAQEEFPPPPQLPCMEPHYVTIFPTESRSCLHTYVLQP